MASLTILLESDLADWAAFCESLKGRMERLPPDQRPAFDTLAERILDLPDQHTATLTSTPTPKGSLIAIAPSPILQAFSELVDAVLAAKAEKPLTFRRLGDCRLVTISEGGE